MKLRYTTVASLFAGSSAWSQLPKSATNGAYGIIRQACDGQLSRYHHLRPLKATVSPEETSSFALTPRGKPIAEGPVVSSFPGGLIAVKLEVETAMKPSIQSPEILGTTLSIPKEFKSSSLGGDLLGRQVVFENGTVGVVVTHRPPIIFVYTDLKEGENIDGRATVRDSLVTISVSGKNEMIDCFGRPSSGGQLSGDDSIERSIFAPIPKVSDIALINSPLVTGVTMFDALAPIGRGQNMLMIGHDIQDMRQYVCDILKIQKDYTKCVYATTGDNPSQVEELLSDAGLLNDVVIVSNQKKASEDRVSAAAEATVTAATACAVAEALALEKGLDTLVIVDTIDQHKNLWDATTRVLVDVFGVDAVVKADRDGGGSSEMRAFFSSLVQRSAQFNKKKGSGSVTLLLLVTIPKIVDSEADIEFKPEDFADSPIKVKERIDLLIKRNIPLTIANLRKIQIPIPSDIEGPRRLALQHVDDLISMSDGQIWLDEKLERAGRRPAMDFQRSVTRIGIGADTESRADAPAMRRVVEGLRLDLSQSGDMDGADVQSNAAKKQMINALAWLLAMHQPSSSGPRKLSESCVAMIAASKGYLSDSVSKGVVAGTSEGTQLIERLLEYVSRNARNAMESVDATLDLTDDSRDDLLKAIESFFSYSVKE